MRLCEHDKKGDLDRADECISFISELQNLLDPPDVRVFQEILL